MAYVSCFVVLDDTVTSEELFSDICHSKIILYQGVLKDFKTEEGKKYALVLINEKNSSIKELNTIRHFYDKYFDNIVQSPPESMINTVENHYKEKANISFKQSITNKNAQDFIDSITPDDSTLPIIN